MASFASFQNEIEQYSRQHLRAGYAKEPATLTGKLAKASVQAAAAVADENRSHPGAVKQVTEVSDDDGRTILVGRNCYIKYKAYRFRDHAGAAVASYRSFYLLPGLAAQ